MPDFPFFKDSVTSVASTPIDEIIPKPVTTTLFIKFFLWKLTKIKFF